MARDYMVAKFSVDSLPDVAMNRLATCMECPFRVNKDGFNYCNKCGCPKLKIFSDSELGNKVQMSGAKCPKGMWKE